MLLPEIIIRVFTHVSIQFTQKSFVCFCWLVFIAIVIFIFLQYVLTNYTKTLEMAGTQF